MLTALIVARKEVLDHCRDIRSLTSTTLYALMGPAVVLMVLIARDSPAPEAASHARWAAMAAVFALMATLTSAASVATDMMAGERERRSLLPLLGAVSSRPPVVIGKWLATGAFAAGGLLLNVLAFTWVLTLARGGGPTAEVALAMALTLTPLALLAAAAGMFVSVLCRSTKESNTYLSMLTFATMGVSMWLAFRSSAAAGWSSLLPIAGQQRVLEWGFSAGTPSGLETAAVYLQSAVVATSTLAATVLIVAAACALVHRDDILDGG